METARIKQLVGELQSNLCNVSVMSDSDLDSLSNMDPNSLVDITGKDFMEQLKDSGRPLCAKRTAEERINLLKLLKDGAIFCSERYPEEAEAIDLEISRQLNAEALTRATVIKGTPAATTTTTTTTTTQLNDKEGQLMNQKTIEQVQKVANQQPPKIIIDIVAEQETSTTSIKPKTTKNQQNNAESNHNNKNAIDI